MNKLFLSLTLISTYLSSSLAWGNPSLGNSAIEQHNKIIKKNPTPPISYSTNSNIDMPKAERNNSLGGAAVDKHKKRVESEHSLRSSNTSNTTATKYDPNNNESLGGSAIKKHENTVDDNLK